jgi:hypothetical protein
MIPSMMITNSVTAIAAIVPTRGPGACVLCEKCRHVCEPFQ